MSTATSTKKFPTTVGIEYTYVIDPDKKFIDSEKVMKMFGRLKTTQAPAWVNRKCYEDCGVIEIPTPVLKDMATLKSMYKELTAYTKQFPILNWHPTEALGGGHIHLGLKGKIKGVKLKERFLKNLYTEITNHPELNWAVNSPIDNINANSLTTVTNFKRLSNYPETETVYSTFGYRSKYSLKNEQTRNFIRTIAQINGIKKLKDNTRVNYTLYDTVYFRNPLYALSKDFAVIYRPRLQTVEFRLFDSPRDWKEQVLFLEIAFGIFEKCRKDAEAGIIYERSEMSTKKMRAMTFNESWKNFVSHMKSFGISESRLDHQKRNMRKRFSYGKSCLK